jgi:hypothetical protein
MTKPNKMEPPGAPHASVELPPDDLAAPETESPLVTDLRARIERLTAQVARLEEPDAEKFERLKNAELDSGVPRQTLTRWAKRGLVKHYYDEHGMLWICVKDAIRKRFALAPAGGPK